MLDKPVPMYGLDLLVGVSLAANFLSDCLLLGQIVFHGFLLESLILAQDERWRRA